MYGKNVWLGRTSVNFIRLHVDFFWELIVYYFLSVHKQIRILKERISELSKTNYDLEREVRHFDQLIGFLIAYKKAIEVQYGVRPLFLLSQVCDTTHNS